MDEKVRDPEFARSSQPRRRSRRSVLGRRGLPYLLMAPAVLAIVLVQIVPIISAIVMSFLKLDQFSIADWMNAPSVGWAHYKVAIGSNNAISQALLYSFFVTVAYTVVVVAVSWALGMMAAVFLAEEIRGRRFLGSLYLLSFALPAFAAVMLWAFMFQPHGAVNAVFGSDLKLIPTDTFWLAGPKAFWAMCVNSIWRTWPFAFMMLLPAVQGIPAEQFEAARVDGASRWREFAWITMPSTRSVSLLIALLIAFWTFNDFTTPFLMFSTAAPTSADVLSLVIYRTSFVSLNFGLGSAMSMLMVAFLIGGSLLYVRALRLDFDEVTA